MGKGSTEVEAVASIAGMAMKTGKGDDEYTWTFDKNGKVVISGRKIVDGIGWEYKQVGDKIFIWNDEAKMECSYEGDRLDILSSTPIIPEDVLKVYDARVFTSSQGDTIAYRLFVPQDYDPATAYPLVLFHHGAGGSGGDNLRNLEGPCPLEWVSPENQAKNPCIIVVPQIPLGGPGSKENGFPTMEKMTVHIQTIHEILDALEEEFAIDTDREYITGLSLGGGCTWRSIVLRPDRFAAAVPICAADWFTGMDVAERGQKFAQFPMWIFHGDADSVVSVDLSRKIVQALKDAGGNPKYTEYPGVDHDSWTATYRDPDLIEWLFAQSRKPN